ncbi:putative aarF domain-containing protein kinase [Nymphaea thermarum]|nr:putative aarF domain-containing protein kinase [Nymphaea thermarum]
MVWEVFVRDIRQRAVKLRETLIQLGPFYVKLGQALSTRPDILPSVYCQELSKLQVVVSVISDECGVWVPVRVPQHMND